MICYFIAKRKMERGVLAADISFQCAVLVFLKNCLPSQHFDGLGKYTCIYALVICTSSGASFFLCKGRMAEEQYCYFAVRLKLKWSYWSREDGVSLRRLY